MASIFIRTKNIPPESDNQYCYLVKETYKDGESKQEQKYIGPTKDIDLDNWDPQSLDEEPPTDYVPGEGMASDKKEEGSIDKLEDLWDALGGKDTNKHDLGEEHVDVYKKDDYKDGYYIAVDEPEHTVKAIFEVDEKDWKAAKEEFNGTDSNAPDQFLSDRQSASVPKINLNEGKGKRIALYDEDGEDVFNYNAFSFKLFEKAVRASRDGSYKNSELAGAEISWKKSEYPMVLETSDMDFVFAPVIIDMDSGNKEFLRYIRDDEDGDYIFISDQHDSVESALGDNPTKPSKLPGFEWEYTPNSDDRRARNLDTVGIEELTPNQQEDWYSEAELREENWIEEHVEDNDEGFYPIPVIERDGSYLVQDGHHRVSYAKLRGLSNVVVETGYKYEYKPVNSDSVKTQYGYEFIDPDDDKLGSMYYREREKEFRQGVENGKLKWVKKDGKRIFGSVVGKTEIYGRSDDLVYIEGYDKEEIGAYNTDVFIEIGGLTLKMEYSYSWNINVLVDSSSLDYELEDNGKEENDKLVIDGQPEYDYSFNVEDLSFVGEDEADLKLKGNDNWKLEIESGDRYVWKSQSTGDEIFVSWNTAGHWTTVDFNEDFSMPKTGYPNRENVEKLRVDLETEEDIEEFLESNTPAEVVSMTAAEDLGEHAKDVPDTRKIDVEAWNNEIVERIDRLEIESSRSDDIIVDPKTADFFSVHNSSVTETTNLIEQVGSNQTIIGVEGENNHEIVDEAVKFFELVDEAAAFIPEWIDGKGSGARKEDIMEKLDERFEFEGFSPDGSHIPSLRLGTEYAIDLAVKRDLIKKKKGGYYQLSYRYDSDEENNNSDINAEDVEDFDAPDSIDDFDKINTAPPNLEYEHKDRDISVRVQLKSKNYVVDKEKGDFQVNIRGNEVVEDDEKYFNDLGKAYNYLKSRIEESSRDLEGFEPEEKESRELPEKRPNNSEGYNARIGDKVEVKGTPAGEFASRPRGSQWVVIDRIIYEDDIVLKMRKSGKRKEVLAGGYDNQQNEKLIKEKDLEDEINRYDPQFGGEYNINGLILVERGVESERIHYENAYNDLEEDSSVKKESEERSELTVDDAKQGDLGSLHTVMATEKGQSFSELQENTNLTDEEIRRGLEDLQELGLIYERKNDYYNYLGEDKTKEEHQKEIEDDSSKSYGGIGGGRRKKLDQIEEFDRLKKLEKSDIEDAEDVRQYIKDMKLPGVATARGSNIDVDDLLDRFNSTYNDLPNEEAKKAYVKDHKMFRTLRSSRRHFNKLVDRTKRMEEMPSPMESGPANYPTGKRDKRRDSLRNQKEKVEEKIDRLYGRLKGAKQRALNSIGSSVGEQNEKKRESEREEMIDYLEEGWTVSFFHGNTSVGRIKRVNKKSVTFEYWGYTSTGRIGSNEGHHEVKSYNLELPSDRFAVIEAELTKPAMEIIEQDDFNEIQEMDEVPNKITEDFLKELRGEKLEEEIDEIHEEALKEKREMEEEELEVKSENDKGTVNTRMVTESKVESYVEALKGDLPGAQVVRIEVDGEEVYNDKEDQGMNEDAVKKLTKQGAMVQRDAAEIMTEEDVARITALETTPMYVSEAMIKSLRSKGSLYQNPDYRKVKVVSPIPSFMGTDLEEYEASEEGEIKSFPEDNAEILVNRGNAEYVNDKSSSSGSGSTASSNSSSSSSSQASDSSEFSSERLDKVRKTIYELDEGEGADYSKLLGSSNITEEEIDYLKKIGDVYEPRGGYLKLLDYELEDEELTKEEVFEKVNSRDYSKFHEGGEVYAFNHKETNQDLWIQNGVHDDGYTIYGDIFRILKENGVVDAPGAEETFDSKSDALHEFKLYAMTFNNNYKDYMDIEEETDSSALNKAVNEILEELYSNPDGIKYEELRKRTDAKDELLEEAANSLLSEGTAYEPRPGVIKKL